MSLPAINDLFGPELLQLAQPLGGPDQLALDAINPEGVFALTPVWGPLAFIGLWACSAVLTGLQYYGHALGRLNDSLVYRRGMISTRSGTVPYEKIQTLRISESVPVRFLGMAKLSVETAGAGGTDNAERHGRELIIPLAHGSRVWRFAHGLFEFEDPAFERPPKRA
ncbi:PH domain-containing protein [Natrinema caseinilyticum]|uniref:PH domain-containing protein n=1 Tax=Natrinema caseinilyticum TaxID=2961570 RepID=UPI003CCD475E